MWEGMSLGGGGMVDAWTSFPSGWIWATVFSICALGFIVPYAPALLRLMGWRKKHLPKSEAQIELLKLRVEHQNILDSYRDSRIEMLEKNKLDRG